MKKCDFCSQEKADSEIAAGEAANICFRCATRVSLFNTPETTEKAQTPLEMKNFLDRFVIGQEQAKIDLCTTIFHHHLMTHRNLQSKKQVLLLAGPSGTGKTYMLDTLLKHLGCAYTIADCSVLTSSGFVGKDADDVIRDLLFQANMNVIRAEKGIVVFDEVDKIRRRAESHYVDFGTGVQQEILKMVEGRVVDTSPKFSPARTGERLVNTRDILFIFLGAFTDLKRMHNPKMDLASAGPNEKIDITPERVVRYGFLEEFVGRITKISTLDILDDNAMRKILMETDAPIFGEYQEYFSFHNKQLRATEAAVKELITKCKSSAFGARSLRSLLFSVMCKEMFGITQQEREIAVLDCKHGNLTVKWQQQNSAPTPESETRSEPETEDH